MIQTSESIQSFLFSLSGTKGLRLSKIKKFASTDVSGKTCSGDVTRGVSADKDLLVQSIDLNKDGCCISTSSHCTKKRPKYPDTSTAVMLW